MKYIFAALLTLTLTGCDSDAAIVSRDGTQPACKASDVTLKSGSMVLSFDCGESD